MATKKLMRNIEAAINRICEDIKNKRGGSGGDKLDSLSKLVNSYSRLIEREKQNVSDPTEDGDPTFHGKLTASNADRKGIIR